MLLLCWRPGAASVIHDHPNAGCWVKVCMWSKPVWLFGGFKVLKFAVNISNHSYDLLVLPSYLRSLIVECSHVFGLESSFSRFADRLGLSIRTGRKCVLEDDSPGVRDALLAVSFVVDIRVGRVWEVGVAGRLSSCVTLPRGVPLECGYAVRGGADLRRGQRKGGEKETLLCFCPSPRACSRGSGCVPCETDGDE